MQEEIDDIKADVKVEITGVKSTVDWHDERGFTFFHFTIKPSSDGCGLTSHKCCSCFDYYEALKGGM